VMPNSVVATYMATVIETDTDDLFGGNHSGRKMERIHGTSRRFAGLIFDLRASMSSILTGAEPCQRSAGARSTTPAGPSRPVLTAPS
jgi:hypothetical protein